MTKVTKLKALQQRVTKARERNQQRIVQLDQFQEDAENLVLKSMEGIANTKEAWSKVVQVLEEHPIDQEVKECTMLSAKVK